MACVLEQLQDSPRLPRSLTVDFGPELTSKAMFPWSQASGVKLNLILPRKPAQSVFLESFNGRFIDGCLSPRLFRDMDDAR